MLEKCRLWIGIAAMVIGSNLAGAVEPDKGPSVSEAGPLTYEFSIKLPDYPSQLAWSRDGKRLAVSQFNSGKVRFVDLESRRVLNTVLETSGDVKMVWSPDDKYLALNDGGKANGLRLFETATWTELGRKPRLTGECILQDGPALGFSKDGKFLWIACAKNPVKAGSDIGSYKAVLKLNVPDLSVAKVVEANSPTQTQGFWIIGSYAIDTDRGTLLSSKIVSITDTERRDTAGHFYSRKFIAQWQLGDDAVLGPTFELLSNSYYSVSVNRALIWPEKNVAVVSWMWPDHPLQKESPVPDKYTLPRLETYDTRTGERIVAFAPTTEHRIPLHDVVLARKAGLVLGALSSSEPNAGAVAAWDPLSGKQIQVLPTGHQADWLWLSHDETRLAVIVLRDIQIFRIN